jgi:hypothetical protein
MLVAVAVVLMLAPKHLVVQVAVELRVLLLVEMVLLERPILVAVAEVAFQMQPTQTILLVATAAAVS